jgi:hypothetical protein
MSNLNVTVRPTPTFNHLNFLNMVGLLLFQMQKVLFHNWISLFQMLPLQRRQTRPLLHPIST